MLGPAKRVGPKGVKHDAQQLVAEHHVITYDVVAESTASVKSGIHGGGEFVGSVSWPKPCFHVTSERVVRPIGVHVKSNKSHRKNEEARGLDQSRFRL